MQLPYHVLIAFILFGVASSQHNPLKNSHICGLPSCPGNDKFHYGPKFVQNYEYSVDVRTLFNGTSKNESSLYISGTARLSFPTPCEGLLTLYNMKLSEDAPTEDLEYTHEHRNSEVFAQELNKSPLRFAFRDGIIPELCPSEDEPEWVLNFKRGILSMLHNSMKRFDLDITLDEEDVRGKCPTQYRVIGAKETSLLIEKTKDLNSCVSIGKIHSSVQSTPLPFFSAKTQKENILRSSSKCTLSVDHNIYDQITCEEHYLLQPFTNHEDGASTSIIQQLTLLDEQEYNEPHKEQEIIRRVPLTFDHIFTTKPTTDDLSATKDLLLKLCDYDRARDQLDLSDIFNQLIYNLKSVSKSALIKLYDEAGMLAPLGRKHLLDALPFVNSGPSVNLMKDLILKSAVSESTISQWMTTIAFIPDPDEGIMEAVSELLRNKDFSSNSILSISSLTHTYCNPRSTCYDDSSVSSIVQYLENYFQETYHNLTNRHAYDNIMVTLKALSNIGYLSEDFQNFLFKVIENSEVDSGLRVAAVETFRRTPCDDTREYFENIFRNFDVDSEVRIAAYLQIMRCPDYLLMRSVRHCLESEEVNQVGSFVWTHLNNLIKSTIPTKVEIQSLISQKDLIRKFDSDVRKFSRNFEYGLYFDDYSIGGSYESNIIFSPSSYIPKSAMLNLSTVLFGESVNLLEIYGRADGFENYLENLFGPKGSSSNLKDDIKETIRWPRSVDKDSAIISQVEQLPKFANTFAQEPKVALGLKIFGNELKYSSFNGEQEIKDAVQNLDPVYHLKRLLSGKELNYNKATMFLDTKFVIPSGAGLPLSLSATGTAAVNVKVLGSLKSTGFSNLKELEADLSADIRPTVSVDVTGEMSVDAFYASTGIKLKVNMFTDTAIQSDIKIRGTNLVRANFSLPKEKNEIFVARSELLVKKHEKEEPQAGVQRDRISKSICSWSAMESTIGLKLCADYSYLNISKLENIPYFFIAGPASFKYYLHKSDPTANIYLFEFRRSRSRDIEVSSITFDTPGSKIKRLLSANLTANSEGQNLTVFLESSAGTFLAKGRYKNLPKEKVLQFSVSINNKEYFDAGASFLTVPIKNGFAYKPTVYINVNRERILLFSGEVEFISKKGISQYTVDLQFETKRMNSTTFGYISTTESTSIEASLYTDYKFHGTKTQRLMVKFGAANRSRKNIVILVAFCSLNSTAYPNLNLDGNITYQRSGSHMDLSVKVKQNPLTKDHPDAADRTLNFNLLVSYKTFTDSKCTLTAEASVSRKSSNLDLKGQFVYETVRHNINLLGGVKYSNNKEVIVTVFWSRPKSTLEQIRTHINVTIPSFTPMILKIGIEEKEPKNYMVDFQGTWFSGHSASALGFYQDKSKSTLAHHHIKLLLRSPSFKDIQVDALYFRDKKVFKLNFDAVYNNVDEYQIVLVHQSLTNEETYTQASVKYLTKLYKFASSVYDGEYKKIEAEVHIDQLRDISFSTYLLNEEKNKSLSFNINWDANRDPNQKLMFATNYRKNAAFDYLANFIISYPGRTVKGDYKFMLEPGHLDTVIGVSWEEGKTLAINLDVLYEKENRLFLTVKSQVYTPLDNWKVTKIDGVFEHLGNKYKLNGILSWDRRNRISLDIFSDYLTLNSEFWCRHSASISSSVVAIPNVNATLWYLQNSTNLDTNVYLRYNPEFVIDVDSRWKIENDRNFQNLTGTVRSETPFKGLTHSFLVSKLMIQDKKYLKGVAELEVDHKLFSINLDGKYKKLTDCMLIVNATTLEDEYQLRFIISMEKRHFVSMFSYPNGNVGGEVLLSFYNLVNFDIKLHLATPVEFLRNVIIVAKLKSEQADFRVGWNALLLGVSGIWHYGGYTDFEYAFKAYTPLANFEENYVVGKLIIDEGLDFEVAVKLSIYKLGLKLYGKDKPQFLKEIGVNLKNLRSHSSVTKAEDDVDELSWEGLIEVDVIIYDTMKGILEIDQKGSVYIIQSKLTTPHGIATLVDEFEFISINTMSNELEITTPYPPCKSIVSNFELDIQSGKRYVFGLSVDYQNTSRLIQTGAYVKYETEVKERDEKLYNVILKVKTPFEMFPKLDLQGVFESEKDYYHTKLLFNTVSSDVSVDAVTDIDKDLLDFSSVFHVITPSVNVPQSRLTVTKITTHSNNRLEVNINSPAKLTTDINLQASWFIQKPQYRSLIELETPFNGFEKTKVGFDLFRSKSKISLWSIVFLNPVEVELNSTLDNNDLKAVSNLNLNGNSYPVIVDCQIVREGNHRHVFNGTLELAKKTFQITGSAELNPYLFVYSKADLKLIPLDNSPPITFEYTIIPKSTQEYQLRGSIQHKEKYVYFNADLAAIDIVNWDGTMEIESSNSNKFVFHAKADSDEDTVNLILNADTPFDRLEHPKAGINYKTSGFQKIVFCFFELTDIKGNANIRLIWNFLEHMYVKVLTQYDNKNFLSQSSAEAFYLNPDKTYYFVSAGGDAHIDRIWEAGSNVTLKLPPQRSMNLEGHLKLPNENKETHSLLANLDYTKKIRNIIYLLKYSTSYSLKKYGTWGKILTEDKENRMANVTLEWKGDQYNNYMMLKDVKQNIDFMFKLKTPKYVNKQLVIANLTYRPKLGRHNIRCEAFYPEDIQVGFATIDYRELNNMNGNFNITLPHKTINYAGAYFDAESNDAVWNRYYKVFWKGNDAVLDSKCNITNGPTLLDSNTKGKLRLEIPLQTRHVANIDYEYDKKSELKRGQATVDYNNEKVLESLYNCITESKAGIEKDTVHVELKNKMVPLGADYVHKYEYGGIGVDDVTDNKHLNVYHLTNRSKFDVTGDLDVHSVWGGQEFTLTVSHLKKTVKMYADYFIIAQNYKHSSRIDLNPTHWLEYDIELINKTETNVFDSQQVVLNVLYPKRSFTATGSYNISEKIVLGDVAFEWDEDKKTIRSGVDWRELSPQSDELTVNIKHPSFEKDVMFYTKYGYSSKSVDGIMIVDYSLDPDRKLSLRGTLNDNSDFYTYNYTSKFWAEHNATNLKLDSDIQLYWNPDVFVSDHITNYQRSYLPVSTSETFTKIHFNDNEIELKKDTIATGYSYFWGKYGGSYPKYTANITCVYDMNHTEAESYINFADSLMYLNMNLTEDGSQSLHMYGIIPDARRVSFNIWRDYDDIRLSDVSYYLKLNHSRLITSILKWRPELYSDVQGTMRSSIVRLYLDTLQGINNTKQYLRSEIGDAANGVWSDAKPTVQGFLNDLKDLTLIEQDLEEFKIFLNNSYYSNDFYIRDIINLTLSMFNESAIKSLPKIFQEIWAVIGESRVKIKESVLWVIEEIKIYYNNTTEFFHGLLNGDPIDQISSTLEKIIEKYDEFIKNLHVSLIQYMENLWSQTYALIVQHWHNLLASLEPTFLKVTHYLESIVWNTGKEFLDFLYLRKNEIMGSPYFVKFTQLSHDVDKFYKDITGNNTIAAIYKYSEIAVTFLKEKYLNLIPFGKELMDIVNEVINELKQIGEIPSIRYLVDKWYELYDSAKYYYEYFNVEQRIQRLIKIVYLKLFDFQTTALEIENRQREAKTKFIFEPDDGIMLLEQKLPMSWHAFNETPKFKEIPEIKKLYDLKEYLETTKLSFWNVYDKYRTLMDPSEWFPPFKGHAMILGSSYYITFDKQFYNFQGSCTYLLTHDFIDHNFTLLVSYDQTGTANELMIILHKTVVHVNLYKDRVQVNDAKVEVLPLQIGNVYLYKESGMFVMESNVGFYMQCNLKFHICTFDVSGWYFAKTAGLLGTYNNEPSDDYLLSNKTRVKHASLTSFADDWSLNKNCKTKIPKVIHSKQISQEVMEFCDELFTSKVSQLSSCFPKVSKEIFLSICLNSSSRQEVCMAAVAYINQCSYSNVLLRIPDTCVQCTLPNGTQLQEGNFIRYQGDNIPRQADVVFIVEAKQCNRNFKQLKNFDVLIDSIERELLAINITDNRYAVVAYGGDGVFDDPRSIIVDGTAFANSKAILTYFDKIKIGHGNNDTFNAIMFALDLMFRPGASRNFILIPCSPCKTFYMEHDYSTIHQLLSESAVSFHILMDDYFTKQKEGEAKVPFGIDRRYAYTKRDLRALSGDQSLRKTIQLPKSKLGLCLSLSLETNGTVFSSKFLESDKKNAKKFTTVYGQRVARSAVPSQCLDCECTSYNSGISFMECYLCSMAITGRPNVEQLLAFEDEDAFNSMNMFDGFSF